MKIFVSTLAFEGKAIEDIIDQAYQQGLKIEFSSGLPYSYNAIKLFEDAEIDKIVHNYFPAPKEPFVLNLASVDNRIIGLSFDHCKRNLILTSQNSLGFYAAHAGFCLDPNPNELGAKIKGIRQVPREAYKQTFLTTVESLVEIAEDLDVQFLIENNVIAPFNYQNQYNPLLCCESNEISWIFQTIDRPSNFGLLLDTGHLKVSCRTLGLDLHQEIEKIKPFIRAVHHSDNDGLKDTNSSLTEEYWFLQYMPLFTDLPHVIEVKNLSSSEISEHIKLIHDYATR